MPANKQVFGCYKTYPCRNLRQGFLGERIAAVVKPPRNDIKDWEYNKRADVVIGPYETIMAADCKSVHIKIR